MPITLEANLAKHLSYGGKRHVYASDELFQYTQDIERSLDTILYTKQSIQELSEHVLDMNMNDFRCNRGHHHKQAIIKRFFKLRIQKRAAFESEKIIKNVKICQQKCFQADHKTNINNNV